MRPFHPSIIIGGGLGCRKWDRVLVHEELVGHLLGGEWLCQSPDAQGICMIKYSTAWIMHVHVCYEQMLWYKCYACECALYNGQCEDFYANLSAVFWNQSLLVHRYCIMQNIGKGW